VASLIEKIENIQSFKAMLDQSVDWPTEEEVELYDESIHIMAGPLLKVARCFKKGDANNLAFALSGEYSNDGKCTCNGCKQTTKTLLRLQMAAKSMEE
jgi:hypothetical protein